MSPHRLPALVLLAAVALPGCGPSVPDAWDAMVPTDGLDMVLEGRSAAVGKAIGLMYERGKVDTKGLRDAFDERFEGLGYKKVMDCGVEADASSFAYAKDGGEGASVVINPLTEEMFDVSVNHAESITSSEKPDAGRCEWLDAADEFCTFDSSRSECTRKG